MLQSHGLCCTRPRSGETYGAELFVPSAVPDDKPPLVFQSMTQDTLSEYCNVRELNIHWLYKTVGGSSSLGLLLVCSSATTPKCLAATHGQPHRCSATKLSENNGGCLSGMTRYSDHLDDMPAIGYAQASIASDRIRVFTSLYDRANIRTWVLFSTEQQSLYQDANNPSWRGSLGGSIFILYSKSDVGVFNDSDAGFVREPRHGRNMGRSSSSRRWYPESAGFSVANGPTLWQCVFQDQRH